MQRRLPLLPFLRSFLLLISYSLVVVLDGLLLLLENTFLGGQQVYNQEYRKNLFSPLILALYKRIPLFFSLTSGSIIITLFLSVFKVYLFLKNQLLQRCKLNEVSLKFVFCQCLQLLELRIASFLDVKKVIKILYKVFYYHYY